MSCSVHPHNVECRAEVRDPQDANPNVVAKWKGGVCSLGEATIIEEHSVVTVLGRPSAPLDSGNAAEVRLEGETTKDTVGFRAPALSVSTVWTLPVQDGISSQRLVTDGNFPNPQLTWAGCCTQESVVNDVFICLRAGETRTVNVVTQGEHIYAPVTIFSESGPVHGDASASLESVSYTADRGYTGRDSFMYRPSDSEGNTTKQAGRVVVDVVAIPPPAAPFGFRFIFGAQFPAGYGQSAVFEYINGVSCPVFLIPQSSVIATNRADSLVYFCEVEEKQGEKVTAIYAFDYAQSTSSSYVSFWIADVSNNPVFSSPFAEVIDEVSIGGPGGAYNPPQGAPCGMDFAFENGSRILYFSCLQGFSLSSTDEVYGHYRLVLGPLFATGQPVNSITWVPWWSPGNVDVGVRLAPSLIYNPITGGLVVVSKGNWEMTPVDPCEEFSLKNSLFSVPAVPYSNFGNAVGISGDYAIIAAYRDSGYRGAAYIFSKDGSGDWSQLGKIVADVGVSGDTFGNSVAISGDYAVVGASNAGAGFSYAGAAYIFQRDGSDWNQTTTLVASDTTASANFGCSVAISGDFVIVGAKGEDTGGANAGQAYIWQKDGSDVWSETQILVASDVAAGDYFGASVAISGDFAIVGAYKADPDGDTDAGQAYIFQKDGSDVWSETEVLVASDATVEFQFGYNVDIDGDYAVIGSSPLYYTSYPGSVYIFSKDGSDNWTQAEKIVTSDTPITMRFGYVASISGNYLIVGSYHEDNVYLYNRNCGGTDTWGLVGKIPNPGSDGDLFGRSVTIDGNHFLCGAPLEDTGGSASGASYMYLKDTTVPEANQVSEVDGFTGAQLSPPVPLRNDAGAFEGVVDFVTWDASGAVVIGYDSLHLGTLTVGTGKIEASEEPYPAGHVSGAAQWIPQPCEDPGVPQCDLSSFELKQTFEQPDWKTISVSVHEQNAIIGLPQSGIGDSGSVVFFRKSLLGLWVQGATVPNPSPALNDYFGQSVAVEGGYAVIGSPESEGHAYVYRRDTLGVWQVVVDLRTLVPAGHPSGRAFGYSVNISGRYVLVGDPRGGSDAREGSAFVFHRNVSDAWEFDTVLSAPGLQNLAEFGASVAVVGPLAVVGEPKRGILNVGAAYVFRRNVLDVWEFISALVPSPEGGAIVFAFGTSVALAGETILVGAPDSTDGSFILKTGRAYVFENRTGVWMQVKELKKNDSPPAEDDRFGHSLSIKGNYAVVGSPGDKGSTGELDAGSIAVFGRNCLVEEHWSQIQSIQENVVNAHLGHSVSLDGTSMLLGPIDNRVSFYRRV